MNYWTHGLTSGSSLKAVQAGLPGWFWDTLAENGNERTNYDHLLLYRKWKQAGTLLISLNWSIHWARPAPSEDGQVKNQPDFQPMKLQGL
jgi:hypothetical protein